MERLKKLQELGIYEFGRNFLIEPDSRHEIVMERILDVIETYKPRVIIKAGLGSGKVVLDLVRDRKDLSLVVVEPSLRIIEKFIEENSGIESIKDIRFINGDFRYFPVDYNVADLIISIDNFDFQETAPVVDEFRRSLQFDGHFFFAGIVLDDNDIDGVFDDFMRILFPLHNDYYIKDDLKMFLNLKDFSFIKGKIEHFRYNIDEIKSYMEGIFGLPETESVEGFINENMEDLKDLYMYDRGNISLPYFTGLFMRRKAG
jgi:ubiquinone/menaquinone biosynthesis C-methylase UbiE